MFDLSTQESLQKHVDLIATQLEAIYEGDTEMLEEVFGSPDNYFRESWDDFSIYDYLEDGIYDMRYLVGGDSKKDVLGTQILVACGGPNIWVDTTTGDVEGYWGSDRATAPMSFSVIAMVNDFAEELFNC